MNANELARKITLAEGKKISLPIGQVKEVMKLHAEELAAMPLEEREKYLKRYRTKKTKGGK